MATHSALAFTSSGPSAFKSHATRRDSRCRRPPSLAARALPVPTTTTTMMRRATAAEQQQQQPPLITDTGEPDALELQYGWKGADAFSPLGDRVDALPPPLPPLKRRLRVVLVRHGQSTWNAEGRVQGSSDGSELTDKGKAQARAAGEMLSSERFSRLFVSPLRRARQTAEAIVTGHHPALPFSADERNDGDGANATVLLPALREVDLYAFQGLLKARGKARHGPAYALWQRSPEQFELKDEDEIGGQTHAPVRELWHRAGLAWRQVLLSAAGDDNGDSSENASAVLVVAHNAVNQALVGAALGLGPEHFRRLLQSNGAATVVDFSPGGEGGGAGAGGGAPPPARASLDRLNETAGGVLAASLAKPRDRSSKSAVAARLVIVRTGGSSEKEALAATLAPALAAGARLAAVFYAPGDASAEAVARHVGSSAAQFYDDLLPPRQGETKRAFWERTRQAWRRAAGAALGAAAADDDGADDAPPPPLVVVLSSAAPPLSALVGHAISGDPDGSDDCCGPQARAALGGALRFDAGGATVVDLFARGDGAAAPAPPAVVRTLNAALSDAPAPVARGTGPLPPMPEAVAGLVD